jgi:transcriptional regulator with XRE-family HTH domain
MPNAGPYSETRQLRKEVGAWLQGLRANAGLSQAELAGRLGLKQATFIAQLENGYGPIPFEQVAAWAKALGVPPAEFARKLLSFYEPEVHRLLFEKASSSPTKN